ncbi:hypothetical protein F9C07_2079694 [Aspergillus flavus]|uniref:Uncharacterized protein n=1 Tax=Aspergillus flavus (strain ATCC 200026 / FGSC A1120 / IAM 13836 / NRRL 3357 / JCM 12722 / SRRC 167) TaxID=332952 RepID=A0A7U2ME83_ASPFN|nr:hypothetical protein F9C07_2079694 [Aspergillus flavus]
MLIKSTPPIHPNKATSHQPTMECPKTFSSSFFNTVLTPTTSSPRLPQTSPEPDYLNPTYNLTQNIPPIHPFTAPKTLPPIHTSDKHTITDRIKFASSLLSHPHYNPPLQTRLRLQEYKTLCNNLLSLTQPTTQTGLQAYKAWLQKRTASMQPGFQIKALHPKIHQIETDLKTKFLITEPLSTTPATTVLDLNLSFSKTDLQAFSNETLTLHLQVLLHRYKNFIPPSTKKEMDFFNPIRVLHYAPSLYHTHSHPTTNQPTWNRPFWTTINKYLTKELPTFNQLLTTTTPTSALLNSVPVSLLFTRTCHDHNLDIVEMNHVLAHILSPDSIPLPEMDIGAFIRDRDPLGLAKRLKRDLSVVPGCGVESPLGRDLEVVFDVVGGLQEGFFELGRSRLLSVPRNWDGACVGGLDYGSLEREDDEVVDREKGGEEEVEEKRSTDEDDSEETEESEESEEKSEEDDDNDSDSDTLCNRDDAEVNNGARWSALLRKDIA